MDAMVNLTIRLVFEENPLKKSIVHDFSFTDALKLQFSRLLICSVVFAQQKENSHLEHYRKKYSNSKKKSMLQKIRILSKNVYMSKKCPLLYERLYIIILKNSQSNFYLIKTLPEITYSNMYLVQTYWSKNLSKLLGALSPSVFILLN